MPDESPFQPGAEVVLVTRYQGIVLRRVAKVHKTGRFTLEGEPGQQFRPHHSWRDGWSADSTGNDRFNWSHVHPISDEWRAKIERQLLFRRFYRAAEELRTRVGSTKADRKMEEKLTAAHVDDIERIVRELSYETSHD